MEYEVGSIADLISGDRTPNRPKVSKKPLTPMKPSTPPAKDVTPRDNKNVKKAKTPKIAFTPEVVRSPRAIAMKNQAKNVFESPKSATKKRKSNLFNNLLTQQDQPESGNDLQKDKGKSQKKGNKSLNNISMTESPLNKGGKRKSITSVKNTSPPKKIKESSSEESDEDESKSKQNNSSSMKKKTEEASSSEEEDDIYGSIPEAEDDDESEESGEGEKDNESVDNENDKSDNESESEHESDNEIAPSDNEEEIKEDMKVGEGSDEEAEPSEFEKAAAKRVEQKERREEKFETQFLDRTLFVGNIPISILKKNHERILRSKFAPYGTVESVRIRSIPVPDFETKPKLAFIEKKFHVERTTVIAYIQFADPASVEKALVENNSILEGNHLRVDKCHKDKVPVDPRKSLFCGGLPFSVEEEELRTFFDKCGEIESVRIVRDRKTQMGKGIAFINFASADGVELALSMDEEDLKIKGRQFRIKRYQATEKGEGRGDNRNNRFANNRFGNNKFGNNRFGNNKFGNNKLGNNKFGNNNFGDRKQPFQRQNQNQQNADNNRGGFGKKRDEQGNKNRKRNFDSEKFNKKNQNDHKEEEQAVKKFKKNPKEDKAEENGQKEQNNDEQKVDKKKSRLEKQIEYKGLIAKKKKKMKQDKMNLEKKKISKILTQPPKNVKSE